MGQEKRRQKRRHLVFYLEVYDKKEHRVGWVADITHEGMMLVGHSELEHNVDHELSVRIPSELGVEASSFHCRATIQWVRPDRNPEYLLMGCRFCEITTTLQKLVDELINVCAFDDSRFIHPNSSQKN